MFSTDNPSNEDKTNNNSIVDDTKSEMISDANLLEFIHEVYLKRRNRKTNTKSDIEAYAIFDYLCKLPEIKNCPLKAAMQVIINDDHFVPAEIPTIGGINLKGFSLLHALLLTDTGIVIFIDYFSTGDLSDILLNEAVLYTRCVHNHFRLIERIIINTKIFFSNEKLRIHGKRFAELLTTDILRCADRNGTLFASYFLLGQEKWFWASYYNIIIEKFNDAIVNYVQNESPLALVFLKWLDELLKSAHHEEKITSDTQKKEFLKKSAIFIHDSKQHIIKLLDKKIVNFANQHGASLACICDAYPPTKTAVYLSYLQEFYSSLITKIEADAFNKNLNYLNLPTDIWSAPPLFVALAPYMHYTGDQYQQIFNLIKVHGINYIVPRESEKADFQKKGTTTGFLLVYSPERQAALFDRDDIIAMIRASTLNQIIAEGDYHNQSMFYRLTLNNNGIRLLAKYPEYLIKPLTADTFLHEVKNGESPATNLLKTKEGRALLCQFPHLFNLLTEDLKKAFLKRMHEDIIALSIDQLKEFYQRSDKDILNKISEQHGELPVADRLQPILYALFNDAVTFAHNEETAKKQSTITFKGNVANLQKIYHTIERYLKKTPAYKKKFQISGEPTKKKPELTLKGDTAEIENKLLKNANCGLQKLFPKTQQQEKKSEPSKATPAPPNTASSTSTATKPLDLDENQQLEWLSVISHLLCYAVEFVTTWDKVDTCFKITLTNTETGEILLTPQPYKGTANDIPKDFYIHFDTIHEFMDKIQKNLASAKIDATVSSTADLHTLCIYANSELAPTNLTDQQESNFRFLSKNRLTKTEIDSNTQILADPAKTLKDKENNDADETLIDKKAHSGDSENEIKEVEHESNIEHNNSDIKSPEIEIKEALIHLFAQMTDGIINNNVKHFTMLFDEVKIKKNGQVTVSLYSGISGVLNKNCDIVYSSHDISLQLENAIHNVHPDTMKIHHSKRDKKFKMFFKLNMQQISALNIDEIKKVFKNNLKNGKPTPQVSYEKPAPSLSQPKTKEEIMNANFNLHLNEMLEVISNNYNKVPPHIIDTDYLHFCANAIRFFNIIKKQIKKSAPTSGSGHMIFILLRSFLRHGFDMKTSNEIYKLLFPFLLTLQTRTNDLSTCIDNLRIAMKPYEAALIEGKLGQDSPNINRRVNTLDDYQSQLISILENDSIPPVKAANAVVVLDNWMTTIENEAKLKYPEKPPKTVKKAYFERQQLSVNARFGHHDYDVPYEGFIIELAEKVKQKYAPQITKRPS